MGVGVGVRVGVWEYTTCFHVSRQQS